MSSHLIEGKDFVAQIMSQQNLDCRLKALCLQAGEWLTHVGQSLILLRTPEQECLQLPW